MSIRYNIEVIRDRISYAASRVVSKASEIIIVGVSKNRIIEEIYEALDAGIEYIGESKVQEAQTKYAALVEYRKDIDTPFNFHFVGHLQTNKVNKALDIFDMIQSVDSLKLAQRIDEESKERQIITDILVEVNTSGEESKFGISIDKAIALLLEISHLNNVCVRGLMTMVPLVGDQEEARPFFCKLRRLRDQINEIKDSLLKERFKMDFLSMGTSQDYEVAVEEGANMLRIGSAIFEGEL